MQNLILVPADQENLNDTIKTIVSFSEVNNILPTAISDKLRERVNNDDGFYCWAIQRGGKQRIFEQMNDDIVIFKPNGQPSKEGNYQYFKYKGQVIFKTICPDLGRHLWSSGSNWDFIYFFQTIAKIKIKHHRLAKELHYKNDKPRILAGTIRVDPVKLHQYVPNENLNAFLDSIDENSENYSSPNNDVPGPEPTDQINVIENSDELNDLIDEFADLVEEIGDVFAKKLNERNHGSLVQEFYLKLGCSRRQIQFEMGHIDVLIQAGRKSIVNEVKRNQNLNRNDHKTLGQAYGYANRNNFSYVMISNGDFYAFFDLGNGTGYEENFKYEFRLTNLQEEDIDKINDLKRILGIAENNE